MNNMKQVLMIVAVFMLSLTVKAQDKTDTAMDKSADSTMTHDNMKDCVMMKDGKMMQMKGGKKTMMKKDMSFPNGAMVMMDGTMKMEDGSTHMLKEGTGVMMDGTMKPMHMKKNMKEPR